MEISGLQLIILGVLYLLAIGGAWCAGEKHGNDAQWKYLQPQIDDLEKKYIWVKQMCKEWFDKHADIQAEFAKYKKEHEKVINLDSNLFVVNSAPQPSSQPREEHFDNSKLIKETGKKSAKRKRSKKA